MSALAKMRVGYCSASVRTLARNAGLVAVMAATSCVAKSGIARASKVDLSDVGRTFGSGRYVRAREESFLYSSLSLRAISIHSARAADASILMRAISESQIRLVSRGSASAQTGLS